MKEICSMCNKEINDTPYYDAKTKKCYHIDCLKIKSFVLKNKAKIKKILKEE